MVAFLTCFLGLQMSWECAFRSSEGAHGPSNCLPSDVHSLISSLPGLLMHTLKTFPSRLLPPAFPFVSSILWGQTLTTLLLAVKARSQ